jgi:peptide/nickel transport system ATP-binding protein
LNNEVVSTLGNRALTHPATAFVAEANARPLIEIQNLNVQFVTSHGTLRAVENLSYSVYPGEMVAIVGESGSGKSTLARVITGLLPPIEGNILFDGKFLPASLKQRDKTLLRRIQMIS